jgi:glycosyltransferase involved in cell wall biosynthesis
MGINLLLEALPLLPPRYSATRLQVIGEGPQKAELESLARQLGLDRRVEFRGHISDQDLSVSLSCADLAVVPTLAMEGFGLATVEALWHGTPVLVTPIGANSEIVEELDPSLVALGTDPAALAAAIANLLDRGEGWDPDRARAYARDRYSLDSIVEATLAVYREALA